MNELLGFLSRYGYWLLLGTVFVEQLGLPLPAVPILVGMGALAHAENFSFVAVILLALTAAMAADVIWYRLGRYYGHSVLSLICRISLEPDYCVRRTEDVFVRRGVWTLLFAKFVPGLNAAAVPLAGMIKTPWHRFVIFDGAGIVLWSGAYATLGYIFSNQVERLILFLSRFGNSVLVIAGAVVAPWIVYKSIQRRRFFKSVEMDRITPEELKARLDSNQKIFVLDLRNQLDMSTDRFRIPGAFHVLPEMLGRADVPAHEEVVLYCT